MWRSDGTEAGTACQGGLRLARRCLTNARLRVPGRRTERGVAHGRHHGRHTSGAPRRDGLFGSTFVMDPTVVGQRLFFRVESPVKIGAGFWVSNGTRSGTRLVRDIRPGRSSSHPVWLVARSRTLFFTANDGRHGRQIWRTDGTVRGTVRVTNLPVIGIREVTPCAGALFFTAIDYRGTELWIRPGGSARAHRVAHLSPGRTGSAPRDLTARAARGSSATRTAGTAVRGR